MAKLPLTEIEKPVKKSGKRVRRGGKRLKISEAGYLHALNILPIRYLLIPKRQNFWKLYSGGTWQTPS